MALNVYTPPETAVVHKTTVDIGNIRPMPQVIKLTQGDKSLPLIAVKLLNTGQPYEVPESATDAVFNFLKGDGKAVINSALGVSEDRQTVYVEATEQTCASAGRGQAILQIQVGEQVAGTGIFNIDVTPNPTTDASLSETEIGVLQGLVDEANDAKTGAQQSASNASKSASDAQASADKASESAELAGQHKNDAESAKNSAEQFANTAEQEATDAENARDKAEEYMEKAQASSAVSNSSYFIGDDGMLNLAFNSDGLGQNDIDQTLANLQSDFEGLQSTIDSLSETVTDQASEIAEQQVDVASAGYKPNLLINSDFRINQRGIADDTWVNATENKRVYGLDGWHCYIEDSGGGVSATARMQKHNEHLRVNLQSNMATFGQYFETGRTIDEITVVFGWVDGSEIVRIPSTFTGLSELSNNGYKQNIILVDDTNMYLRLHRVVNNATNGFRLELRLTDNQNVTYEFAYIDAFEGIVPLPHVSEPIETALARCQRYFCRIGGESEATIGIGFLKNNSQVRTCVQFPVTMANPPTQIVASSGVFQCETETNAYNSCVYNNAVSITRDRASLNFTLSMPEQISGPIGVTVYENTGACIDFSCEYYN